MSNDDDPPIDDVVVVVLLPPNGLIGALDVLLVEPPRLPRPPNGSPLKEVVEADATVVRLVSPNPNLSFWINQKRNKLITNEDTFATSSHQCRNCQI